MTDKDVNVEKQESSLTVTDEQIVTERKMPRRSFLTASGALFVGAAALATAVRAVAQQQGSDPDSKKASDPDKKKASDPDKKKASDPDSKKASDPDSKKASDPDKKKASDPDSKKASDPDSKKASDPDHSR